MAITAFYAGLLAFLFAGLSVRVIAARRSAGVALGDSGNSQLMRRIRVHANFAEYVPLALVLLALAESLAVPAILLHVAGIGLCVARALHAYGVSMTPEPMKLRVAGMVATFTAILCLALMCLGWSLMRMFSVVAA